MKIILLSLVLISISNVTAQIHIKPVEQTEQLQSAIKKTQEIITSYFNTASDQDKHIFAEYLKNYKSAGGYQAVTPASQEILQAVNSNPALQQTFNDIKQIAQQFTQPKTSIPGASSLTPEGEALYAALIQFVNKTILHTHS